MLSNQTNERQLKLERNQTSNETQMKELQNYSEFPMSSVPPLPTLIYVWM